MYLVDGYTDRLTGELKTLGVRVLHIIAYTLIVDSIKL